VESELSHKTRALLLIVLIGVAPSIIGGSYLWASGGTQVRASELAVAYALLLVIGVAGSIEWGSQLAHPAFRRRTGLSGGRGALLPASILLWHWHQFPSADPAVLQLILVGACAEEVVFRQTLPRLLRAQSRRLAGSVHADLVAALLSQVAFAASHQTGELVRAGQLLGGVSLSRLMVAGVLLQCVARRMGLAVAVVVHAYANLVLITVPHTGFGLASSAFLNFASLGAAGLFGLVLLHRTCHPPQERTA
jgi:membrane protease YdiL (CAAX protease family)